MTTETVFSIESNGQKFFQAVLSPDSKGIFSDQLDSLLQKYDSLCSSLETDSDNLLLAKVFLSDYTNQKDDIDVHPLFTDRFSSCGLTIIGQPPLNGFKINVLLWFIKGKSMVKYRKEDAFYAHIDGNLHIFQSIRNDKKGTNLEKNTQLLFEKYNQLLREHGMSVRDNCVRTWLFVRDTDKKYIDVVSGLYSAASVRMVYGLDLILQASTPKQAKPANHFSCRKRKPTSTTHLPSPITYPN